MRTAGNHVDLQQLACCCQFKTDFQIDLRKIPARKRNETGRIPNTVWFSDASPNMNGSHYLFSQLDDLSPVHRLEAWNDKSECTRLRKGKLRKGYFRSSKCGRIVRIPLCSNSAPCFEDMSVCQCRQNTLRNTCAYVPSFDINDFLGRYLLLHFR